MANEFIVKNGLILSGSWYVSESMYGPNFQTASSVNYYLTWRQSDGRFEISNASGINLNTIGCWDYTSNYPVGTGEWTDLSTGITPSFFLWLSENDNGTTDQSAFLNTLGTGSILVLNVDNQNLNYVVDAGPIYSSSLFGYSLVGMQDTPEPTLDTLCLASGGQIPPPTPYYFTFTYTSNNVIYQSGSGSFSDCFGANTNTFDATSPCYVTLNSVDNQSRDASFFAITSFGTYVTIKYTDSSGINYSTLYTAYSPNFNPQYQTIKIIGLALQYISGDVDYSIQEGETFTFYLGQW